MFMVKNKSHYVINKYPKEHYLTLFDRKSGFFARVEEKGYPEPLWSSKGPELIDISITNWCDKGCSICYRNSNTNACHMNLGEYETIMVQARKMKVLQVALGGGNPNQHPDFSEILRITKEKYGIVPSYTTNGRGLDRDILEASAKYCGAVAVSAYEPYKEMTNAIKALIKHKIKVNIHFVLTSNSIKNAINWLESPLPIMEVINAIIFLNYKPVGDNKSSSLLLKNSKMINDFFDLALHNKQPFKIGFDSCLISGITKYDHIPSICYEYCDSGRFSMYISEELKMYPCSFMVEKMNGIPITKNNILDTWVNNNLFVNMREREPKGKCINCNQYDACQTGCPIFPEINICN